VKATATYPEIASALIRRTITATKVDGPSVATRPILCALLFSQFATTGPGPTIALIHPTTIATPVQDVPPVVPNTEASTAPRPSPDAIAITIATTIAITIATTIAITIVMA